MERSLKHYTQIDQNTVITRFAPSPTGHLHLGHLYAAKVAHDFARESHGQFLLRFEDIDITRVKQEYYDSILDDLSFFGLTHDAPPISQLEEDRVKAYDDAIAALTATGVTYPCFCSRKDIAREIASLTSAPHQSDSGVQHYPGTCRNLSSDQINSYLDDGKIPSIRIDVAKAKDLTGPLTFKDLIHGDVKVDHHILGDCVLARRDIGTSYHIASVVDDAHQHITHVTRGDDLLDSTHLHRVIQSLLNLAEPLYLHHALVVDSKNERLAKRAASISLKDLRSANLDKASIEEMMLQQIRD